MSDLNIQVSEEYDPHIPKILPHEKVYSIQVGYKLFKLSGLSLSSDAPSYFTRYFSDPKNEDNVLFFDRNPEIFQLIYNHLQGYSINITDDYQFMHVWSDCFYFGLKNLQNILTDSDIYANVGGETFKIPKVLFSGGNSPNYFTTNYDRLLLDNMNIIEQKEMLRPPPQRPATIPNRSPTLFKDLLELLRGNDMVIVSDEHRKLLIRECRYYRFLELEQRLIRHKIIEYGGKPEIILNLLDLTKRGVINVSPPDKQTEVPLLYTRPHMVKEPARNLIVHIEPTDDYCEVRLSLNRTTKLATVKITNRLSTKITQVFKDYLEGAIISEENDVPTIAFLAGLKDSRCTINGRDMNSNWIEELFGKSEEQPTKKRKKSDASSSETKGEIIELRLKKSMWRFMMRGSLARLHAVAIDAYTDINPEQPIDYL
ncbi:Uncharacterized protein JA1_000365 [Spathaspora sp. JA1]|nr:Uncharacterized protein JA1_000365 [Spathaspora sp. JA1]